MSVDRSKLKWDGPPSQKAALIALYAGHVGLAVGILGGAATGEGIVTIVCVLGTIAMYFVAFFLERRERRRERAEQGGPFGR